MSSSLGRDSPHEKMKSVAPMLHHEILNQGLDGAPSLAATGKVQCLLHPQFEHPG